MSVDLIQTRGCRLHTIYLTFHQHAADVCNCTDVFLVSFVLKTEWRETLSDIVAGLRDTDVCDHAHVSRMRLDWYDEG